MRMNIWRKSNRTKQEKRLGHTSVSYTHLDVYKRQAAILSQRQNLTGKADGDALLYGSSGKTAEKFYRDHERYSFDRDNSCLLYTS